MTMELWTPKQLTLYDKKMHEIVGPANFVERR